MTTFKKKQIHILVFVALMTLVVALLYPIGNKLLLSVRGQSYSSRDSSSIYRYSLPEKLAIENISVLSPAEAVPILMYHGIIANGPLETNTSRETFINQMEMLKQKGYETISIKEYDLFREGKFTLPLKPIIITFDDGRKDSFYPVNEVLKKLGFKATLFVATIMANKNDSFYLNWDELKNVQATGRWEIEAHGRRSHEEIPIDENGTTGRYLTSRMYIQGKGLESIEDYKKRVEQDYIDGITDIKEHLGIYAHYLAVPLNSYGALQDSNYGGAYKFNQDLTRKYFKLAFIQAQQENVIVSESFYNYKDSNPYKLMRLEVKNLSTNDLLKSLEHFAPRPATLAFSGNKDTESFLQRAYLLYGSFKTGNSITLISSTTTPSARMIFGDKGWKNYSIKTNIIREEGRSASVIIYYGDEDNLISLDWGDKSLLLIERANGKERELASYYPFEKDGEVEIILRVYNGIVSAYFNGVVLTNGIPTKLSRGAAGFSVWDPKGAQSTIKKLEIESLTSAPQQFVSVISTTTVATSSLPISEVITIPKTEIPETILVIDKTLPYFSNGFNVDDWQKVWGDFSIADGILNLGANASTTGGGILLNGSNLWRNYVLNTKIDWLKSGTFSKSGDFSLLLRYQDPGNYVVCSYSNYGAGASLVQVIDGKATTLIGNYSLTIPSYYPWLNMNLGMSVKDNHIECLMNDEWVLRFDVNTLPQTGGIGFEIWDPINPMNTQIQIKDVSVTPL